MIYKDFELCSVFMYNFLCQTVLIFPIFTKVTETFWSREVTDIWVLSDNIKSLYLKSF